MGLNAGAGAVPVPERDTGVIGTLVLLFTVRVPVREPEAVGWKVTLTVHEELTARDEPQLLVWAKSPVT